MRRLIAKESIRADLELLIEDRVTQVTKLFTFASFSKFIGNQNYNRSFVLKSKQAIFVFHQNSFGDEDIFYNFLKFANEYEFCSEIQRLGCFLLETIKSAK